MNENDLFNFQLEYTFTADWLAELDTRLEEIDTKAKDLYIRDYSGLHSWPSCCPHGRAPCRWIGLSA